MGSSIVPLLKLELSPRIASAIDYRSLGKRMHVDWREGEGHVFYRLVAFVDVVGT